MSMQAMLLQVNSVLQIDQNPKVDEFNQLDPYGIGMAVITIGVVFLLLFILYFFLSKVIVLYSFDFKEKKLFRKNPKKGELPKTITTTGEVTAAISMAVYLYRKHLNDIENFRLTIDRVSKTYSPWSSKIYGLRQMPNKK